MNLFNSTTLSLTISLAIFQKHFFLQFVHFETLKRQAGSETNLLVINRMLFVL